MGFFSHNTTQTTQLAQTPLPVPPLASPLTTSTSFPSFSDPLRSSFLFPLSSLLANGPDFNSLQKVIGHSEGCQSVSANANHVGGYKQENSWFLPQISSQTPTSFASSLQPPVVDLQAVFSLCALRNSELLPTTSTTTKGTKSDDTAKSKTKQIKRKAVELEVEKTSVVTKQRVEAKQSSAPKQKPKRRIKYCKMDDCMKYAQGGTDFCVSHGGGRRCTVPGCKTGARGSTKLCILHGGGKRCQMGGCSKSAIGSTSFCIKHGGGRRCTFAGCKKAAQGATTFCVRHGGGRRCSKDGCNMNAKARSQFCRLHSRICPSEPTSVSKTLV